MSAHPPSVEKICRICGEDCSNRPRTKDRKGRYYCRECYKQASQRRAAAKAKQPPHPTGAKPPPPRPKAAASVYESEDLGLLEGLAAQEGSVEAVETGQRMGDGVGPLRATPGIADAAKGVTSAMGKVAKVAGTFVLGCVLSAVGALVGAAVWCLVAVITEYEIGYIAWGVGVLAGFGMVLGYRERTQIAGFVAAGMSVFGILVAKVSLFAFILYSVLTGGVSEVDRQRPLVTMVVAEEILEDSGVKSEDATEAQWELACTEAKKRVEGMNDEEVRRQMGRYRAKLQAEAIAREQADSSDAATAEGTEPSGAEAGMAKAAPPERARPRREPPGVEEAAAQEDADAQGGGLLRAFFSASFDGIDIVFILLAVVSAYSIAGGRESE